ncbi:hypothetical protein ROZALSC1DRAFT_27189 [Rozella allomycis CSF55]|uniref:Outer kinetochore protein DAM1 n=1 Tax=Rozella allomycis (strain CSF55) TaxID=988480 RepID=A0A075AWT2_ROZAC|nr:hypothetical protein O9G_003842 [Rozella allomycis CSF55]RKP21407.1 hypothetical protein ROZALSC1DRAFT_27189 [Rozella allomycis CSF55]|eukprot:EPZ33019.1 hypothetical protein O9G_003842 [Rozella allomycis CSF55]
MNFLEFGPALDTILGELNALKDVLEDFVTIQENANTLNSCLRSFLHSTELISDSLAFKLMKPSLKKDIKSYECVKSVVESQTTLHKQEPDEEDKENKIMESEESKIQNNFNNFVKKEIKKKPLKGRSVFIKKLLSNLEMKYRQNPAKEVIVHILGLLYDSREMGVLFSELAMEAGAAKTKVTEYVNMLLRNRDIVRVNKKGLIYSINFDKHRMDFK